MEEKIVRIVNAMAEFLSIEQLKKLQEVIVQELSENEPQRENNFKLMSILPDS